MLVLSRQRLSLIIGCLFVSIFAFMFVNSKKDEYTVPTVSLPISGKTIVVDAGHGVPDEGAESSNGTTEAETNLKIALKFQKFNRFAKSGRNMQKVVDF